MHARARIDNESAEPTSRPPPVRRRGSTGRDRFDVRGRTGGDVSPRTHRRGRPLVPPHEVAGIRHLDKGDRGRRQAELLHRGTARSLHGRRQNAFHVPRRPVRRDFDRMEVLISLRLLRRHRALPSPQQPGQPSSFLRGVRHRPEEARFPPRQRSDEELDEDRRREDGAPVHGIAPQSRRLRAGEAPSYLRAAFARPRRLRRPLQGKRLRHFLKAPSEHSQTGGIPFDGRPQPTAKHSRCRSAAWREADHAERVLQRGVREMHLRLSARRQDEQSRRDAQGAGHAGRGRRAFSRLFPRGQVLRSFQTQVRRNASEIPSAVPQSLPRPTRLIRFPHLGSGRCGGASRAGIRLETALGFGTPMPHDAPGNALRSWPEDSLFKRRRTAEDAPAILPSARTASAGSRHPPLFQESGLDVSDRVQSQLGQCLPPPRFRVLVWSVPVRRASRTSDLRHPAADATAISARTQASRPFHLHPTENAASLACSLVAARGKSSPHTGGAETSAIPALTVSDFEALLSCKQYDDRLAEPLRTVSQTPFP